MWRLAIASSVGRSFLQNRMPPRRPCPCTLEYGGGRNDLALTSLCTLEEPYEEFIQPAICTAAKRGLTSCVRMLLWANPSSVNAVDEFHSTPLLLATRRKDAEMMRLLLQAGAGWSTPNYRGHNVMAVAAHHGPNWVDLILSYGVSVTRTKEHFAIALFAAAAAGHNELITYLLDLGADPTVRTDDGSCILHIASYDCWPSTIKLLIDRGVDVNCTNNANITPLYHVAIHNRQSIASLGVLFEAGADPSIGCSYFQGRRSPIDVMSFDDTTFDCIKLFHKYGANLDPLPSPGESDACMLLCAFDDERLNIVEYILEHSSATFSFRNAGDMVHCHGGRLLPLLNVKSKEMAEWILANSDINDTNGTGSTVLHRLAETQAAGWILEMVIHAGADVAATDHAGDTPLHIVCRQWTPRMNGAKIAILMKNGADALAVNLNGETPLMIAEERSRDLGPDHLRKKQSAGALKVITKHMAHQARRKRKEHGKAARTCGEVKT